ncbi:SKR1B-like protein, partial [Mya arenaria]
MDFDISAGKVVNADIRPDSSMHSTILKTPEQSPAYPYRQNTVSNVLLHGIPIVSLLIDGKERLCLAQISNTLLKQFSYNEIHNRRVALGITCVQCTPVQLEILRRAGAMPISSRRCGMITKREAERLVKSFLEDNRPPKLPENFFFEVIHKCGWGCKGKFEPSRYNSSRAKCIRCNVCNLYFSPNKFIFHFHRTPDAKYNHPDAANFNSWRRHLHLCNKEPDDVFHAWEDVKAMFNGGSRKRMVSSPGFPDSSPPMSPTEPKRPKQPIIEEHITTKPNFTPHYQPYPLFSMPGKNYTFNPMAAANPLSFHYPLTTKPDLGDETKQHMTFSPWRQPTDMFMPPYDLLWASQFSTRAGSMNGIRQNYINSSPVKDLSTTDNSLRQSPSEIHTSSEDEEGTYSLQCDGEHQGNHRPSAFRPVRKTYRSDNTQRDGSSPTYNVDKKNENEEQDIDVEKDVEEEETYEVERQEHDGHSTTNTSPEPTENDSTIECIEDPTGNDESAQNISTSDNEERKVKSPEITQAPTNNNEEPDHKELARLLQCEMDVRRQVESDIDRLRRSLEDRVSKEKSQRDDISVQLQVMK